MLTFPYQGNALVDSSFRRGYLLTALFSVLNTDLYFLLHKSSSAPLMRAGPHSVECGHMLPSHPKVCLVFGWQQGFPCTCLPVLGFPQRLFAHAPFWGVLAVFDRPGSFGICLPHGIPFIHFVIVKGGRWYLTELKRRGHSLPEKTGVHGPPRTHTPRISNNTKIVYIFYFS